MKASKVREVLLFMVTAFVLSGCGSPLMGPTQKLSAVDDGYAVVSFVRPSSFGGAILFSLWDGEEFIGILTAGSMVEKKVTPGEHVFLARGENWSYVKATLQAGRHYVIEGKVFPGVWKARVGLAPINVNESGYREKAEKWLETLKPTGVKPDLVGGYVAPRREQVKQALEEYKNGNVKFAEMEPFFAF